MKRPKTEQLRLCFASDFPVGAHVAERLELERFGRIEEVGMVIPPRPIEHYWQCAEYFERDHEDPALVFVATIPIYGWVGWNVRRRDQLAIIEVDHKCELNLSKLPLWEKAWEEEAKKAGLDRALSR